MTEARTPRYGLLAGLLLVALTAGWVAHGLATQPADTQSIVIFDNWRLVCPTRAVVDGACELQQDVVDPQSHITTLRIVISGNAQAPTVDIATVSNVLLPPGLGMALDGRPAQSFPYRTCEATSCIAKIKADAILYASLLDANKIEISITNLNGKAVAFPLAMGRYADAVAALADAQGKHTSWLRRVFL